VDVTLQLHPALTPNFSRWNFVDAGQVEMSWSSDEKTDIIMELVDRRYLAF